MDGKRRERGEWVRTDGWEDEGRKVRSVCPYEPRVENSEEG